MSLKIIVGYHKPCVLMNEVYFVPMHLGRALVRNRQTDQYKWMKLHTIGDDVGENISSKNQTYNEMTGLFWAWKNYSQLGNPDYIGFSHYRRFLVLNDNYKTKGGRWTVDFPSFTESPNDFMRGLGYTQKNLSTILGNFDFVASCVHCNYSVLEQYKAAEKLDYHHLSDLRLCVDIISEDSPDYIQACESYLGGNEHFYGNMFILPKDLFFRYCEFIFPVLSKFEKKVSLVDRSSYEKRFFVSERLTGIFFKKLEMEGYKCTPDVKIAKKIAQSFREAKGGYQDARAIGVYVQERNITQVSCMINYQVVPLYRIIEMVRSEARRYGVSIIGTDVCGMVSREALMDCCEYYMQLENFDRHAQVLEELI